MGDKADKVVSVLQAHFSDPELIAAFLGNIQHETGGSYDHQQKQYGGGPGVGLFQMENMMHKGYLNWLEKNELQDSADSQVRFMYNILNSDESYDIGYGNRKKINEAIKSSTVGDMTTILSDLLLRPGKPQNEKRINNSEQWYNKLYGE